MNRLFLPVLLGLSAVANVWLLLAPREAPSAANSPAASSRAVAAAPQPSARAANESAATTATAATPSAATAAVQPVRWRTPVTDADYRTLAADLRAAGVPPRLIYTVLRDLYRRQKLADSPLARASYWQRRGVEMSKEMRELNRQIETDVEALLGPIASPAARLSSVARARRYGDLPEAKIDLIAGIERDYQEMQIDVYSAVGPAAFSPEEWADQQKQTSLLKAELRADLAKVLTPAELEAFDLRNSDTARQLANSVRDLTVSEDEFRALFAARQQLEAQTSGVVLTSPEQIVQRRAAQAAYMEAARGILPEERFYPFLAANESDYRAIANLGSQFAHVTPATAYQAWQLKNQFEQARGALLRSRPSADAVRDTYAEWNARLDALLGVEAAEAYRKTSSGRAFNAPASRRTTPTTSPTPPRG
jgi:hypothetical protein